MSDYVPLVRYNITLDDFEPWTAKPILSSGEPTPLQANKGEEAEALEGLGYELVDQWSTVMGFVVSLWRLSGPDAIYILAIDNAGDRAFFYCRILHDLYGLLARLGPITKPQ